VILDRACRVLRIDQSHRFAVIRRYGANMKNMSSGNFRSCAIAASAAVFPSSIDQTPAFAQNDIRDGSPRVFSTSLTWRAFQLACGLPH